MGAAGSALRSSVETLDSLLESFKKALESNPTTYKKSQLTSPKRVRKPPEDVEELRQKVVLKLNEAESTEKTRSILRLQVIYYEAKLKSLQKLKEDVAAGKQVAKKQLKNLARDTRETLSNLIGACESLAKSHAPAWLLSWQEKRAKAKDCKPYYIKVAKYRQLLLANLPEDERNTTAKELEKLSASFKTLSEYSAGNDFILYLSNSIAALIDASFAAPTAQQRSAYYREISLKYYLFALEHDEVPEPRKDTAAIDRYLKLSVEFMNWSLVDSPNVGTYTREILGHTTAMTFFKAAGKGKQKAPTTAELYQQLFESLQPWDPGRFLFLNIELCRRANLAAKKDSGSEFASVAMDALKQYLDNRTWTKAELENLYQSLDENTVFNLTVALGKITFEEGQKTLEGVSDEKTHRMEANTFHQLIMYILTQIGYFLHERLDIDEDEVAEKITLPMAIEGNEQVTPENMSAARKAFNALVNREVFLVEELAETKQKPISFKPFLAYLEKPLNAEQALKDLIALFQQICEGASDLSEEKMFQILTQKASGRSKIKPTKEELLQLFQVHKIGEQFNTMPTKELLQLFQVFSSVAATDLINGLSYRATYSNDSNICNAAANLFLMAQKVLDPLYTVLENRGMMLYKYTFKHPMEISETHQIKPENLAAIDKVLHDEAATLAPPKVAVAAMK